MILLVVFGFILFVYFVKFLIFIVSFAKKVSKIPTAPHASNIPLLGHLPILLKMNRESNLTASATVFNFMKMVQETCPEIQKTGIFKIMLGPLPFIAVINPEAAGILFRRSNLPKSFLYKVLDIGIRGLITLNGPEYRHHKKLLTPAFDREILKALPEIVSKRVAQFIEEVDTAVENNQGIIEDISTPLAKMSGFVLLESSGAGLDLDGLAKTRNIDQIMEDWNVTKAFISDCFIQPWLMFDSLLPLFEYGRRASKSINRMLALGDEGYTLLKESLKNEKKEQVSKKPTFLEIMIRENEKNPLSFTKEDVMGELRTFIATGFDSISTLLPWLLHYLGHYPRVQQNIFNELESVFGDSDRPATAEDLEKLQYLKAVFKESLRLTPPVPVIVRDADDDITIVDDIVIPKYAPIFIFPHFIHRDSRHWNEPEKFVPERFLRDVSNNSNNNVTEDGDFLDLKDSEERYPYAFVPFSAGSRICIGSKYATIECLGVLSAIMRKFKIRSLNPIGSIRSNPQITYSPIDPVSLQFSDRRQEIMTT